MPILIILVMLLTANNICYKVQAYELEKPLEMTYVRWNTAKNEK